MNYPKPYPRFVFDWWARWAGEYIAAQYMVEDGYISWRKARVIMFFSDVLCEVLGKLWWWKKGE